VYTHQSNLSLVLRLIKERESHIPSVDKASEPPLDVVFVRVKINCMKVSYGKENIRQLHTTRSVEGCSRRRDHTYVSRFENSPIRVSLISFDDFERLVYFDPLDVRYHNIRAVFRLEGRCMKLPFGLDRHPSLQRLAYSSKLLYVYSTPLLREMCLALMRLVIFGPEICSL